MNQKKWELFWKSADDKEWKKQEQRYFALVAKAKDNFAIEEELAEYHVGDMWNWSSEEFYDFLYNKYFVWKYTAKNRLATTRKQLETIQASPLGLSLILKCLETLSKKLDVMEDYDDHVIKEGLMLARMIPGLGIAGASGLLAILFPSYYGTVDQFVVKSLEAADVDTGVKIPESISLEESVILEKIMYNKAKELNNRNNTSYWTPRKVDMILWAYRSGNELL